MAHSKSRDLGERLASSVAMASFNRVVDRGDWGANLARELARADVALKPSEFLAIRAGGARRCASGDDRPQPSGQPAESAQSSWVGGLALGFWLPRFWLNRRKSGRLKAFNGGLADTIMLLANSLRSGSSFLQSVEMVVREDAAANLD